MTLSASARLTAKPPNRKTANHRSPDRAARPQRLDNLFHAERRDVSARRLAGRLEERLVTRTLAGWVGGWVKPMGDGWKGFTEILEQLEGDL